jgi:hypothetical protein
MSFQQRVNSPGWRMRCTRAKAGIFGAALLILAVIAGAVYVAYSRDRGSALLTRGDGQAARSGSAGVAPGDAGAKPPLPAANPPAESTTGWVDNPAGDTMVGPDVALTGWALDPNGIRGIEIRVGGKTFPASFGIVRPEVTSIKPGYPDSPAPGFEFKGSLASIFDAAGNSRQVLEVVALGKTGTQVVLARKNVVLPIRLSEWKSLYVARGLQTADPFFVLPGISGITLGGPQEIDTTYTNYLSPTVQIGIRVPVLFLRTTQGAANDWRFDPNWDVERRCGERRIAEDSLGALIAYSKKTKVPVLFTLNGGIWADAACDVPEWDVNDHLEQDKKNCQWNDRDEVMPDDYLKHLPGSQESPELGRSLSFNVYAAENRFYKRRNLQAAGRIIKAFADANPGLFVGIDLDPDTSLNPFFNETQWYDYNPDTLKQFRHWLAGTGPYAGRGGPGVPDLRSYRRARPLALADVNRLSGRDFKRWEDVDPPRTFPRDGKPFWEDPWTHEWEVFRRHLVKHHLDELTQWLLEVGISPRRIYSSQGFMAPHANAMPFAARVESPTKNYNSGGISIEGSVPRHGHLGAIVYGPAAANDIRMETPDSLFGTFHRLDPNWAIVEFNTADLRAPTELPDYGIAYRTLREAFNFGARFVSPMAWNGSNGLFAGQPGYVSYTSWRNTPLEDAMRDFAISHAYVPLGTRLWTFGSARLASDDGWKAEPGTRLAAGNGSINVQSETSEAALLSPAGLAIGRGEVDLLVIGANMPGMITRVRVDARGADGNWVMLGSPQGREVGDTNAAGILIPIVWPATLQSVEQIRIAITTRAKGDVATLRHLALYPAMPAKLQNPTNTNVRSALTEKTVAVSGR